MLPFAINHMTVPHLRYDAAMDLARAAGCTGIELRNDLGNSLFAGDDPAEVARAATGRGLTIHALAEVKAFNDWSQARAAQALRLIAIAARCGATGVALIPRNDGQGCGNGERQGNLRLALRGLAPMLADHGLIGLIEPLGFARCSLRSKQEAADAIADLDLTDRFALIHDTFHHHLAGGGSVFADLTAMIHVSAVIEDVADIDMTDAHRVLPGPGDRLDSGGQLRALRDAGYAGPVSIEAFAPSVHALPDATGPLRAAIGELRAAAGG